MERTFAETQWRVDAGRVRRGAQKAGEDSDPARGALLEKARLAQAAPLTIFDNAHHLHRMALAVADQAGGNVAFCGGLSLRKTFTDNDQLRGRMLMPCVFTGAKKGDVSAIVRAEGWPATAFRTPWTGCRGSAVPCATCSAWWSWRACWRKARRWGWQR